MPTPALVTVNFDFAPDAKVNQVTFWVPTFIRYNSGPDTIVPSPITVPIATDGTGTVQLYGTNDPQWSPSNWNYRVSVEGDNLHNEFYAQIPYDAGTLNFSQILPAESASLGTLYAAFNHSHGGGGGGSTAWADITGKPPTFPPTLPIAQSGVTNLTTDLAGKSSTSHNHSGTYDPAGTASSAVAAHVAAGDPHSQYLTQTEGDAAYSPLGHTHGGGGGSAVTVKRARITSGDVTPQASVGTWALLTGGPTFSFPAAVGDYVSLDFPMFMYQPSGSTTYLDLATVVGGVPQRCASSDTNTPLTEGNPSLYPTPSSFRTYSPIFEFVVGAGDLSAGNVNINFLTKGNGVGFLYMSAAYPLKWRAINYGPITVT